MGDSLYHPKGFGYYEYSTFSGADIVCSITVPVLTNDSILAKDGTTVMRPITIANLQTISVSTFTDKSPVRAMGTRGPRGYTRGTRFIGGSMVFTMFDRESLAEVNLAVREYYRKVHQTYSTAYGNSTISSIIPAYPVDELPPFDVTITMVNDNGQGSIAKLIGVEILSSGQVMGIDDLFIEETMQFQASQFYPMYPMRPYTVTGPTQLT